MNQASPKAIWKLVKLSGVTLITIAGLLTAIRAFDYYVEDRIRGLSQDERFLREISSKVRPSLIFDEKGSILVDQGALDVIEKIELQKGGLAIPSKIIVVPKRYLSHAPLLSPLDPFVLEAVASRGNGLEWVYDISYTSLAGGGDFSKCRYRLEVLY